MRRLPGSVGGETRFACTDGPEFDGHQVDWEVLMNRQKKYNPEQKDILRNVEAETRHTVCE